LTGILSPLEYELIFFDQLGSGKSDCADPSSICHATQPASIDDFVEQIEQVRKYMRLPVKSTVLFGHSWGVMLAIEHALKYPGTVSGYTLAGFPASLSSQMRRMHALRNMNVSDFKSSFICRTKPCPQSFLFGSNHCNIDLDRYLLWTNGGMSCTGVLCNWDRMLDLKNVTAPALLIVGDFDIAAPADVRAMADIMPNATLAELQNCGHAEWIDAPAGFAKAFSVWVRRVFVSKDVGLALKQLDFSSQPLGNMALSHSSWLGAASLIAGVSSVYFWMGLHRRLRARTAPLSTRSPLLPS